MRKHILGFAVFSLIVTAAFYFGRTQVKNYLNPNQRFLIETMKPESSNPNGKSVVIRQAVFDTRTRQLNLEFQTERLDTAVALHFFVKDDKEPRYVMTSFTSQMSFSKGSNEYTFSYEWMDNLQSFENLYIVPEVIGATDVGKKKYNVKFDKDSAVSVLLYTGEKGYLTEKYLRK